MKNVCKTRISEIEIKIKRLMFCIIKEASLSKLCMENMHSVMCRSRKIPTECYL